MSKKKKFVEIFFMGGSVNSIKICEKVNGVCKKGTGVCEKLLEFGLMVVKISSTFFLSIQTWAKKILQCTRKRTKG